IRSGNTTAGLDMVVLCACWTTDLTADEVQEVQFLHSMSFLDQHVGYRLNRLAFEVTSKQDRQYVLNMPGWEIVDNFEAYYTRNPINRWGSGRGLAVIDKKKAVSTPASVGALLFRYQKPILNLRDVDQRFLIAALPGLTDDELSNKLSIG